MANKNLVIQIQPDLLSTPSKDLIIQDFIKFLNEISPVGHCSVSTGDEDGSYINIELQSGDVQRLWEKIQNELSINSNDFSVLAKGIVVVCEGDKGWDDYLQLHHYDPSEKLDSFNP